MPTLLMCLVKFNSEKIHQFKAEIESNDYFLCKISNTEGMHFNQLD